MPRIRSIKPAFFRSHAVAALPYTTRLTFIGLWTYCDDDGRGIDDPRLIKGELWALDDKHTVKKVEADLAALAAANMVQRYEVAGHRYLRIRAWKEHQVVNRPQPSKIPPPPETTHAPFTDPSGNHHGTLSEPSREEVEGNGSGREMEGEADREGKDITSPNAFTLGRPPTAEIDDLTERQLTNLLLHRMKFPEGLRTQARHVVLLLAAYVDRRLIEEAIGYCGKLKDRPRSPQYLVPVINQWATQRQLGIPEIVWERAS